MLFKAFTFWSEHLILYTRESLRRMLEAAGFQNPRITGVQRYPFGIVAHLERDQVGRLIENVRRRG